MLAQMFSGETGIPIGELGIIGDANPTSAEALRVAKDDLIAEAEQTTDNWSPDVSSAVTRALAMLNRRNLPADLEIKPLWRNPDVRLARCCCGCRVEDHRQGAVARGHRGRPRADGPLA
jgi:hypothetical protein